VDRPTKIFCSRDFVQDANMSAAITEETKDARKAANAKYGMSVLFEGGGSLEKNVEMLKRDFNLTDDNIRLSPALSGALDGVDASVFALDFYPAIYIGAAILAVLTIAVKWIAGRKKAKKSRGGKK